MQKRTGGKFAVEGAKPIGRPPAVVEKAYLKRLHQRVSPEAWDKITDKAIEQAINGDRYARQWLSDYCMGKPTPQEQPIIDQRSVSFDLSNLSGDELKAAIQLAQLVNAPGGTGEAQSE